MEAAYDGVVIGDAEVGRGCGGGVCVCQAILPTSQKARMRDSSATRRLPSSLASCCSGSEHHENLFSACRATAALLLLHLPIARDPMCRAS